MLQRKHILKFSCVGSDCIDHCCGEWTVKLNAEDVNLLQKNLSQQEQQQVVTSFGSFHKITQTEGKCAAQCKSGLCTIQQRFGHAALPSVCASFPRFYGKTTVQSEMGGFLSCPEIARISLMQPDGNQLESNDSYGRAVLDIDISQKEGIYYSRFHQIRDIVTNLLSNKEKSLAVVLYAVGEFSKRSPAFFNRNAVEDKIPILIQDMETSFLQSPVLREDDRSLVWDAVFAEANRFAAQKLPYAKPAKLLRDALRSFDNADAFLSTEKILWKQNQHEMEEIWRRFFIHDWNVRWYVHSADLVMHWERTLFKWAINRIMVASNEKQWKSSVVQSVYSTERLVEHTVWQRQFARAFWPLRLPIGRLFLAFHPRSLN